MSAVARRTEKLFSQVRKIAQNPWVRGSGADWPRAGKQCLSVSLGCCEISRKIAQNPWVRGSGADWMTAGKTMSERFPPAVFVEKESKSVFNLLRCAWTFRSHYRRRPLLDDKPRWHRSAGPDRDRADRPFPGAQVPRSRRH
jgi:hypothetical protein